MCSQYFKKMIYLKLIVFMGNLILFFKMNIYVLKKIIKNFYETQLNAVDVGVKSIPAESFYYPLENLGLIKSAVALLRVLLMRLS